MKKIVRVIARLNIGGPAIHTVLLTAGLNGDGYEDMLVTGRVSESEGDMIYFAKDHGVDPVIIPELGREISLKNDLKAFWKLYLLMRKEKPDIVHTHTAKAGALGRMAAILAGVPVKIHTFHGHVFDGYFSPLKARIFLWVERFLGNFTDKVIAVSEKVKDEVSGKLKVINKNKCVVIPLGLELDKFLNNGNLAGNFRKALGLPSDVLLVGIVGRLVPIKNHALFLKVAKRTRELDKSLQVKFIIIGDGELRDDLGALAKEMGLSDVIFTGWVKDLSAVYADLDISAITSLNEGTPVSLIEAMASGKAVISTDVGGVKDLIRNGENGVLVDDNDVESFSVELVSLLKDKDRRLELGRKGQEYVAGKYRKERLIKDMKELYSSCFHDKKT